MYYTRDYRRNYYDLNNDPWIDLALGIVTQAVKDYKKAVKHGLNTTQFEKFFNSDWFGVLTRERIDGKVIIEKIGGKKK